MKAQSAPIVSHHIHFFGAQKKCSRGTEDVQCQRRWLPANPAAFTKSPDCPGLVMNFAPSQTPVAGTQGRALDHIGLR